MTNAERVKQLKMATDLGLMECKAALDATDWDYDAALALLKTKDIPKSTKPLGTYVVFSYVHHNQKTGALLLMGCATDFVAKNEEFQELGKRLALQVAGFNPQSIQGLLEQPSLKNSALTVADEINEIARKFNEPIVVSQFVRFPVGPEATVVSEFLRFPFEGRNKVSSTDQTVPL